MAKKTPKATIKKAHRIARSIMRSGSARGMNPWAVGMATAKRAAAKRRRRRKR